MSEDTRREDAARDQAKSHEPEIKRRWLGPLLLAALILVPVGILIFSNLESTEVTWAGFEFDQPLWLILIATFVAGMIGGKIFGWAWRKWRQRRRRLKEELAVLRKHAAESEKAERAARKDQDDD